MYRIFPALFGSHHAFERTIFCEEAIRIVQPDILVILDQIDVVCLEALQGFVDLLGSGFFRAAIEFRHQKRFLTITVTERHSHAFLALAVGVVPAIIEKSDAAIQGRANDANCLLLIRLSEMRATESDSGHAFAGAAELGDKSSRSIRSIARGRRLPALRRRLLQGLSSIHIN